MRGSFGHLLLLVALLTMAVHASSPAGEQHNVTYIPFKYRQVNVITAPLKSCPEGQRRDLQDNCRQIIAISPDTKL